MDLRKELSEKNYNPLDECIKVIHQQKELILYGAGVSGTVISGWLRENGIIPKAFVDSNPDKIGQIINNVRVYSKSFIETCSQNVFIIVCCGDYATILEELICLGINEKKVIYIDPKWITQPGGGQKFIDDHISELQSAFDLLEDELSRRVFLNMLKYRISYDVRYIKEVCSNWSERYFDKALLSGRKIKNYVDAGGYTGDTVDAFIEKFGVDYQNIYVFEPNSNNVRQLKKNIEEKNYQNISVFAMGLSDKPEELLFDISSNIATRINSDKGMKVKCDRLDHVLRNKQIDFIKMDIEGVELAALNGSKEVLKKQKPMLAICVYHKPEDYYEIPIFIKNICPDYKLYFRQYELSDTETICYAIEE